MRTARSQSQSRGAEAARSGLLAQRGSPGPLDKLVALSLSNGQATVFRGASKPSGRILHATGAISWLATLLLFLPAVTGVAGDADRPARTVMLTPSGRFTVLTRDPATAIPISRRIEILAGRLERFIGMDLAASHAREFRILVSPGSKTDSSATIAQGTLIQQLTIDGSDSTDWTDAQERFCEMMLASYLADLVPADYRLVSPPDAPDWLSAGVACCIDPLMRVRARKLLTNGLNDAPLPSLERVLGWRVLAPGESRDKALCASAVAMLASKMGNQPVFAEILKALAANKPVNADWIAARISSGSSAAQLEKQWEQWLNRETGFFVEPGSVRTAQFYSLRETLAAIPGNCGVPTDAALPPAIELRELIPLKDLKWMPAFCNSKTMELKTMAVGRPWEFVGTVDLYCMFFDALAKRKRDSTLLGLLAKADRSLFETEALVSKREAYMDEMEIRFGNGQTAPGGSNDVLEQPEPRLYGGELGLQTEPGNETFDLERRLMDESTGQSDGIQRGIKR